MNIDNIIKRLKSDTNNSDEIIYRYKDINNKKICIIFNESLTSSSTISDFIIRSINNITFKKNSNLLEVIENNISNFKYTEINTYESICYYINYGFTIILIEDTETFIALETRQDLSRGISTPQTETALRGAMDSFVENIQTNMGLIRRRIKSNDLWVDSLEVGKYTKTKINILYMNNICKKDMVEKVKILINNIDIDGIISIGTIKNLIENENKSVFPTIFSTERPDKVCASLLRGKIIIMSDTSQFALILPIVMNDLFISTEDNFSKSINITLTRIIRYLSFFITLLTPGIYLALITYNQEMLPTELLVSFATQTKSVPFPAFFECLLMLISFEILRESDLRSPTFTTSALSTVGALILGEAAVNAGIVSPIMIIVVAITSLSALLFTEPEIVNGMRYYRLFFMISSSLLGLIGLILASVILVINLVSLESFGISYLSPYSPLSITGLKNSIIKFPTKDLKKREKYLSNNITKYREKDELK